MMNKKWNDIVEQVLNNEIALGDKKLKQLRERYGENTCFFLLMYPGTGDMFYTGMLLKDYCAKNSIETACVLVTGEHLKEVAALFDGYYVEVITSGERNAIEKCKILDEDKFIHLLHYDAPIFRDNIMINKKLRGLHGIGFLDLLLTSIFGNYSALSVQKPKFNLSDAQELINKIGLNKGKSVILSPYANTLPQIPIVFWENLAKKLCSMGYAVYTNVSPTEMEVKGSKRLEMKFDVSVPVLEFAGNYIGLRSGFTDIISMSKSKKIILYPKHLRKGFGDSLECYSLVKSGIDLNAREIIFDEEMLGETSYMCRLEEEVLKNMREEKQA